VLRRSARSGFEFGGKSAQTAALLVALGPKTVSVDRLWRLPSCFGLAVARSVLSCVRLPKMCRMPDSRPIRLVKKWLRGGGTSSSTKTTSTQLQQSRPLTTATDGRRTAASGRSPPWVMSSVQRPSSSEVPRRRPRRNSPSSASSSPSGQLLCAASFCCGRRRRSRRDVDSELQQTVALVGIWQPFRAVHRFSDDEVKTNHRSYYYAPAPRVWGIKR